MRMFIDTNIPYNQVIPIKYVNKLLEEKYYEYYISGPFAIVNDPSLLYQKIYVEANLKPEDVLYRERFDNLINK